MNLRERIKLAEGLRLIAYKDSVGVWTIGYGHTGPEVYEGLEWDVNQAEDALDHDLLKAQLMCANLPEIKGLDQCRVDAVTELVFNMGLSHWMGFTKCRSALTAKVWQKAHDELEDSIWYTQVGSTRGNRLCDMLLTGTCP